MTVMTTHGTTSARAANSASSAATSMLPLNGWSAAGTRPSGITKSSASAPDASTFARVVSKCVFAGITLPGPPSTVKRMCSAARPWCVGTTWRNGKSSRTAARKRSKDGEPA